MIKNIREIIKNQFKRGLNTNKNFFLLEEGQSPACINVVFNNDFSVSKKFGTSTMNTTVLESTGGYGMYDFGVLGVGGNDTNTNLLLHFDGTPIVDSSRRVYSITTYGDIIVSSLKSKFGGASGLFATNPEIDYMEYTSNANAQAAYASSDGLTATGGTITTDGDYTVHTFTSSGTFTVTGSGNVEVLVVAGGGGGGGSTAGYGAGGGGAGGLVYHSAKAVTTGGYTVTIGGGGVGGASGKNNGTAGENSVFGDITALGGGYGGGSGAAGAVNNGGNGGCGGGAGADDTENGTGGSATQGNSGGGTGFGFAGGNTTFANGNGGCGGGAGAVGPNGTQSTTEGGAGKSYSISGSAVTYATGGGSNTTPAAGTANRGDGGDGCLQAGAGTAGGSGVVIVRYLTGGNLQCYSEATIKQQGSYSLKGIAVASSSLNDTLIRTLTSSAIMDLREQDTVSLYLYSSRTGANIRIGLQESAATLATMQTTPYIITINSWHAINWNISSFAADSKDGINRIIFTIMEDSATNTFFVDSITSGAYKIINRNAFLTAPYNADWTTPGGLGNFSLDNWLDFNYVTTSQVLIGQGSNSTNYWHLVYNTAATNTVNGLYFQAYSGGTLVINLSGLYTPNTGSFTHYELVRNNTNNWYLFVAGSNIFNTGTTAGLMPGSGSLLKLGVNVVTTNNSYLCAFADEWRYSNNARHTADFTPPTVAYHSDIIQERRLLCASGTGIYYSVDIGKTWAIIQTNRTANINYFNFIKDYVINTNESYDPPQYWAGTASQYFANISTATPACKHSLSHQGFAILLNESANKTSFYYVDQNSMFNSAWSSFKLPTDRNDELTCGFSLGRSLYISSKYKIFRLNYIGGNPDWEYVEVRGWGFISKTVKKINLPGIGEAVIGLDWTKKIRLFFGADDEIISDTIARNNGVTPFYLDNMNSLNLNKCWAEDDKKMQIYRLYLVYANSSTISYCINFNYRTGAWYPEDGVSFQSGVLASDTADSLFMLTCDYNGRIHQLESGNTIAGTTIDEQYTSSFFYSQSPSRVHKSQQIDLLFATSSSGTIYLEDRTNYSNVWNLRKTMTLASAISSIQIRHTIDIPETTNIYQFKLSSSANTAEPWRLNYVDYSHSDIGLGKN